MGDSNERLNGFSWRAGVRRDTTGITFWSDVFLHDADNGEKLAIIVVDSQGLFDNETTVEDNSRVFSISTLLTSQQILNLSGVIQEDQLQYLQFATEFATFNLSRTDADSKPFQSFMFLIRDWSNPDEYNFGVEGGKKYLDEVLKTKPSQSHELQSVRQHIKSSFDQLTCCLLPYPGKEVARNSTFDGRWALMDEDFMKELKELISALLKPDSLVIKKIDGVVMTSSLLNEYFQQYLKIFQNSKVPPAQTIYESTVDKFLSKLVDELFGSYKKNLKTPQTENEILSFLASAKSEAINAFQNARKMGNQQHASKYQEILEKKIESYAIEFKAQNMASLLRIRAEQQQKLEAEREAERLKLQREEQERQAQARIAQLQKEAVEREQAAAKAREELRLKEIQINIEIEKQRVAEEQRQRELAEQKRIEEERRRQEEERIQREQEEERRRRVLLEVRGPVGINFDVPKPKCEIM